MKKTVNKLLVVVATLGISGFPAATLAGSCGYEYCWGAVAVGPGGAYGYSHSWGSEDEAYDAAMQGCEYDCDTIQTFYNTCAAIATASNGGWGWGYDSTRHSAEVLALGYCSQNGPNCQVRVWSCSQ